MEHYAHRSLYSFIDEEKKSIQSPTHHNLSFKTLQTDQQKEKDHNAHFSPPISSYSLAMPPPSPHSPWTLSPLHTPSPSLLHHCIASLHRHDGNIYSIAVSSNRSGVIFTGSDSRRIRAWRQPDCTERGYLKASSGEVRAMLSYGNMLFTSHKDHKIRVWSFVVNSDGFRGKKVNTLPRKNSLFMLKRTFTSGRGQQKHKGCVSCLAYYHGEGLLYTGSWDKTVNTWRVSDGQCVDSFQAHEDNVNAIIVNQDDGCLFTCSSDGSIRIWRRLYKQSSHTLTLTLKVQPSPVNALALSTTPNAASILYSGSSDGYINFWEKEKSFSRFNHGGFLQGHRFGVLCLVAIEKLVFSGSEDTTIRVWRRREEAGSGCFHECLAVLEAHRGPVRCLAACLEVEKVVVGFLVYSASLDQSFKVWRVKVLPEEEEEEEEEDGKRFSCEGSDLVVKKMKVMEYEMSPVLSPSWVEKKLQGSHIL